MLNKKYKQLCKLCAKGKEPVRREWMPGKFMWMHDSVVACKANDLREEDKHKSAITSQK